MVTISLVGSESKLYKSLYKLFSYGKQNVMYVDKMTSDTVMLENIVMVVILELCRKLMKSA